MRIRQDQETATIRNTGTATRMAFSALADGNWHYAWGQRRAPDDRTVLALLRLADTGHGRYTTRGFTGHEMLDAVGIIHMNGRYCRFLAGRQVCQWGHDGGLLPGE